MNLINTGWTDEARAASLAVRRAKAAARKEQRAREEMFERQREESGRDFIDGWYPRGRDGFREDPHYGVSTPEAPYGYVEGTMDPRKEPLYDRYGRPIIPRPWEDYHPKKRGGRWEWVKADPKSLALMPIYVGGEGQDKHAEWLEKVKAAEELWGRFGKKKRFFDKNPEATEADWERYDAEQLRQWIERKKAEERAEAEARKRGESVDSVTGSEGSNEDARTGATKRNRQPMNTLILNRESFELPEDGWYQVAPLGEFPHRPSGVVQVVDKDACDAMANAFTEQAKQANFAGLLIDFDHFSLDDKLKSEAAGWIVGLENRGPRAEGGNLKPEADRGDGVANGAGLWAKIRWSDLGEEVVKGGRYRFLSPVWSQRDCVDLGDGRLRPVRLLNAAVTNDPNLKGMVPLSNRNQGDVMDNAAGEQRYKWTLGDSPDGRHCPTCVELAGQVHTMQEWEEAGLGPGGEGLYCQGNCHCSLEKTDDPVTGDLKGAPVRKEDAGPEEDVMADRNSDQDGALANIGWTDAARAASLAVRQAKAAARSAAREAAGTDSGSGSDGDDMTQQEYELERLTREMDNYRGMAESAFKQEYGYLPTTPDEIAEGEDLAGVPDEYRTNGEMTPAELAEKLLDAERGGEDVSAMSSEDVEELTSEIREKLRSGERLDPGEEAFLQQLADSGYAGESDSDPVFNWMERKSMEDSQFEENDHEWDVDEIHGRAEELIEREAGGESLSDDDRAFLARYREIVGNRGGGPLGNKGWTDEARAASLAVRRAKAAARETAERHHLYPPDEEGTGDIPKPGDEESGPGIGRGRWPYPELPDWWRGAIPDYPVFWPGGTPEFDEGFGRPVWPPPWPIRPEPDPEPESDPEPNPEPVPVPEMHPPYTHFPGSTGDPYVGTRGVYRGPTGNLFTIQGVGPSAVERPVNDPSAWVPPGLNVKGPAPTFYRGSYPRIWGPKESVEEDKGRRRDLQGRKRG